MRADNTVANFSAVNPQFHFRTKYIVLDLFITHEVLEDNLLVLLKVESVNNLADICTKFLAKPTHQQMVGLFDCR